MTQPITAGGVPYAFDAAAWQSVGTGTVIFAGGNQTHSRAAGQFTKAWLNITLQAGDAIAALVGPLSGNVDQMAGLYVGAGGWGVMGWVVWHAAGGWTHVFFGPGPGFLPNANILFSEAADENLCNLALQFQAGAIVAGLIVDGAFVAKHTYSGAPTHPAKWISASGSDNANAGSCTFSPPGATALNPAPDMTVNGGSALLGQHLRNFVVATGAGFGAGAAVKFGLTFGLTFDTAADCDRLTLIYGGHDTASCPPIGLTFRTPLCDVEGTFYLWIMADTNYAWSDAIPVYVSGAGYNILRALLAPGRYTADPADPGNVVLAAVGHRLDLLESSRRALVNAELWPETADALLWRHEAEYSIPTNYGNTLAARRNRVLAARNAQPRITRLALAKICWPYLGLVTPDQVVEQSPYSAYGELIWQCEIYEGDTNELSSHDWSYLVALLARSAAAWTRLRLGHNGFHVGGSRVGRDFT